MCTNQTILTTRSRYINLIGGQSKVKGFCGKCPECRAVKASQFQTRAFYEYERAVKNNGFVVFDTLTYNDDAVPSFSFSDSESPILCFRKQDINTFLDTLQKIVKRAGYHTYHLEDKADITGNIVNDKRVNDLRYCIVSEFGSDGNRPHYHALFFVTIPDLTPLDFLRFVQRAWNFRKRGFTDTRTHKRLSSCTEEELKLIRKGKEFCNGTITSIIDPSPISATSYTNAIVTQTQAINYVSKYISKQQPREREIESVIKAHYFAEHPTDANN